MINKILFISLSNIGDAILTLPALDHLSAVYPQAQITVITAVRPKEIFENHPAVKKVIIYDKRSKVKDQIKLCLRLAKENFDLVVDLRNTFLGTLLFVRYKVPLFLRIPRNLRHMRDIHLYKTQAAIRADSFAGTGLKPVPAGNSALAALGIRMQDKEYIESKLKEFGISDKDKIVVIAAGARSHIKRWPKDRFAELIPLIIEDTGARVILAGDNQDLPIASYIAKNVMSPVYNLAGATTISQLACLLKKASLLVTNDSAVLHLAGYLNTPTVAIFGPTDETRYGPWSSNSAVVKKEISCRPCAKAQCVLSTLECMSLIKAGDVLRAIKKVLSANDGRRITNDDTYKRILVSRTDRIGDVLLSTPVIKSLREAYPRAYIAMMVSPYAGLVVEGNPDLDSVIIYDKGGKHKSWFAAARFSRYLKKKKFDLAIILHPTNRAHLLTFFAGIAKRVGYDRKLGFLLTDRLRHTKHLGEKHEAEYNLDLLRYLGINCRPPQLHMPINKESQNWAIELLKVNGIGAVDKLLGIHPAASCPSKVWPPERFAEVADKLSAKYGFKTVIVAGPRDTEKAKVMQEHMHTQALNLAGKASVSQLASILKRCSLFISNDSGPVHMATAVSTPVISIFGRAQKGLGPKRWGPMGPKDKYLHKDAGCITCLAHNCVRGFVCLESISVDDVIVAADEILKC